MLCQDVRGRFDSEGDYIPFLNEDKDGAATIDWIGRQAWCSGAIGMWGASYLAYVQWAAAAQKPPQLKALAPIIGNANLMHYPEHGFPLDLLLRWMVQLAAMDDATLSMRERLRRINSAEVQDSLLAEAFMHLPVLTADVVATGTESTLYREMADADGNHPHWQMANHTATVAQGPPASFVGGWYDLFLDGLLDDFMAQQQAGLDSQLTVGPWFHLSLGYLPVAYQQALDWFAAQLKGEPSRLPEHPVRLYMMGANRWRAFDSWPPPAQPTTFYSSRQWGGQDGSAASGSASRRCAT